MMSTLGAQQLLYLLPVYPLLCLRLLAGASGNTYRSAPRERQGAAANASSGPIVKRPLPGLIRTGPCLLSPLSESRGKGCREEKK